MACWVTFIDMLLSVCFIEELRGPQVGSTYKDAERARDRPFSRASIRKAESRPTETHLRLLTPQNYKMRSWSYFKPLHCDWLVAWPS